MGRHSRAGRAVAAAVAAATILALASPTAAATPRATPGEDPAPASEPVVAAMGDSITAGGLLKDPETQAYPARAGIEGVGVEASCAVNSDACTASPLPEWFTEAIDEMRRKPDTVVLLIGINDIALGQPYSAMVRAYRGLERKGRRLGVRVVFGTLVPTSRDLRELGQVRLRVNEWIRSQETYVDYAADLRKGQWLDDRYDCGDGLHPSARGHRRMARTLSAWIATQSAISRR